MTPQTFVKQKHPDAKNMYCDGGGHAIMVWDKKQQKTITLAYGNSSANAWKNAKENILSQPPQRIIEGL
jgi:hypothetical protein